MIKEVLDSYERNPYMIAAEYITLLAAFFQTNSVGEKEKSREKRRKTACSEYRPGKIHETEERDPWALVKGANGGDLPPALVPLLQCLLLSYISQHCTAEECSKRAGKCRYSSTYHRVERHEERQTEGDWA